MDVVLGQIQAVPLFALVVCVPQVVHISPPTVERRLEDGHTSMKAV